MQPSSARYLKSQNTSLIVYANRLHKSQILKKSQKVKQFFWYQLSLKKAKFVKFGVKKANLGTLQRWSESLFFTPILKKVIPPLPRSSLLEIYTPTPVYTSKSWKQSLFCNMNWSKITACWTILLLANMDEYCHAFSDGKQVVVSCLCRPTAGFP